MSKDGVQWPCIYFDVVIINLFSFALGVVEDIPLLSAYCYFIWQHGQSIFLKVIIFLVNNG